LDFLASIFAIKDGAIFIFAFWPFTRRLFRTDWKKPELKIIYGVFVKAFFTIKWFNDINKIGRMINWRKNKIMGIRKSR